MQQIEIEASIGEAVTGRSWALFGQHQQEIYKRADRLFAGLMICQWLAGIFAALWISPQTWDGPYSQTHLHVWAAIFLGGAITSLPVFLALTKSGSAITRHVIAVGQMLMSALLIHLTGGRIETHFHVFGSLAFLAFYRDWKVLISASAVIAADHFLRGIYWPQSVYGVLTASPWRWLEHAGWVVFEVCFLIISITQSKREMWGIAERKAGLEASHDNIERKVRERTAELQASEERYRLLFESSPLPMWVYDLDTLAFLAVNNAAMYHYGYEREEFLSMTIKDIRPPEDLPLLENNLLASEGKDDLEVTGGWRHRKKDGTIIDVEITSHALLFAERHAKLVMAIDITERKRAEEQLKAFTAKLEQSNRELQDFASIASHDLQEPLRKIQSFGERLKAKYSEALSPQGCDYLERMQNAAGRMRTLIDDLLTFSRVTTKAQPFVPVDLGETVQGVLSDLEVRIEQSGGKVEVAPLPSIDADPLQMRQLMQNLISNGLKFHRAGEVPVVKIYTRTLNGQNGHATSAATSNGMCHLIVEDNGIGFDEKYTDRIFTIFQRLHGREEYEGTGIGLAVCRKIAERHHGNITAQSQPGQGATFIVTLPLKQQRGLHD